LVALDLGHERPQGDSEKLASARLVSAGSKHCRLDRLTLKLGARFGEGP